MPDAPRFSVLVPHHPNSSWQAESLAALAAQAFDGPPPRIQVLVAQLPEDLLEAVPLPDHVQLQVVAPETSGVAAGINQLLVQARGDYVAWCQPGDTFMPTKLAEQGGLLDEDPELGGAFSFARFVGADGQSDAELAAALNLDLDAEELAHRLLLGNVLITSTAMLRRSLLAQLGPVDETRVVAWAYDLWLRAHLAGGLRVVPLALTCCRVHEAASSERASRRLAREGWQVLTARAGAMLRRWPPMPQTNYAFLTHVIQMATQAGDWQVALDYLMLKRQSFGHDEQDCLAMLECTLAQGRMTEAETLVAALEATPNAGGAAARARLAAARAASAAGAPAAGA